jgi:hypothetical protein
MQGTAQADQQQNVDPRHRSPRNIAPDAGSPDPELQQLYRKVPLDKGLHAARRRSGRCSSGSGGL